MDVITILNLCSAAAALAAAGFWFAVTMVKTPKHRGVTWDMTNLDFLTVPLVKQARFNRMGALFACLAATLQGVAILAASNAV